MARAHHYGRMSTGNDMRVLIADDSDMLVERLVVALTKVPNLEIVGRAWTGAGALESIWRLKPDIVILDLCMPGGSGIDLLEDIKKNQLNPMVIVLTNYGQSQYRKKCLQSGASLFFDKSVEFEKVAEALRGLISGATASSETHHEPAAPEQDFVHPSRTEFSAAALSRQDGPIAAEKPKLLVTSSSQGEPIYYMCSCCLRGFPLADNQHPKQAMKDLYEAFRKHVEEVHPDVAPSIYSDLGGMV